MSTLLTDATAGLATTTTRSALPGFGRPLNYVPQKNDPDYVGPLFPNALSSQHIKYGISAFRMTTLREFAMLQLMNSITDKPDWNIKITNPEIVEKWKAEALASGRDITPKMVDWCIAELLHNASLIPAPPAPAPPIFVFNGDVVKSDTAVSQELKKALQDAVQVFESKIPERQRDWHPDSNEQVWDLVHPSLFPLIYGRTRVLGNGEETTLDDCISRAGQGEVAPVPPEEETEEGLTEGFSAYNTWEVIPLKNPFSKKFQWLPCEVDISGKESKITSYINNLHPSEKTLYTLISKLVDASIPLWERTLAPLRAVTIPDSNTRDWPSRTFNHPQRISYSGVEYDPDPENGPETDGPQQLEDEDEDAHWDRREEWYQATRKVVLPEPEEFNAEEFAGPPKFSLREEYAKRGLQVIVKLANIELTPEKPTYEGGSWHVEGQMNEHIVATALYYYSSSNITPSSLAFRQQTNTEESIDINYPQNHHEWLPLVFGCEQDGAGLQEVGTVDTREGRLLTFPNVLQHRVGKFELEDKKKRGWRKIVALFLVDPGVKVISTKNVPCQQQEWWWNLTRSLALQEQQKEAPSPSSVSGAGPKPPGGVARLPLELQDHILEDVDFPISLEEAKKLRLELMEERKKFVVKHGAALETSTFSLCEH